MNRVLVTSVLFLLLCGTAWGGAVDGPQTIKVETGASSKKIEFNGGEVAIVVVAQKGNGAAMTVKVFDSDGNKVASDSDGLICIASWTPSKKGVYTIEISGPTWAMKTN